MGQTLSCVEDFTQYLLYPDIRTRVTRAFFRNQRRGEPFLPASISTDFSLQLTEGLHNYNDNRGMIPPGAGKQPLFNAPAHPGTDFSPLSPRQGQN